MRVRFAKEGPLLLAGTFVSLVIAMSYGNNLVYIFAFAWLGFCFVALAVGVAIIKGFEVTRVEPESGFVGEKKCVRVTVKNSSEGAAAFLDWKKKSTNAEEGKITHLASKSQTTLETVFVPERRGRYPLPEMCLATIFPAAIFRISLPIAAEEYFYAYPRPEGARPLPEPSSGLRGEGEAGLGRGEDFSGHRMHQSGESERHVDWKLFARTGQKQVKDFVGGSEAHVVLQEAALEDLPFESRLEQLAKWVMDAEAKGLSFGLNAAGRELEVGKGPAHRRRALELLATAVEAA